VTEIGKSITDGGNGMAKAKRCDEEWYRLRES
jgi:hypothetical protein